MTRQLAKSSFSCSVGRTFEDAPRPGSGICWVIRGVTADYIAETALNTSLGRRAVLKVVFMSLIF